jgi:chemotaxis protein methyltransferase CheR
MELDEFIGSVYRMTGYDFTDYSVNSVRRRVEYFMGKYGVSNYRELEQLLYNNDKAVLKFIQAISITVTEMFRDPEYYKSLRRIVFERLATYSFSKIWIAGCATGEEIYSVAIMLKEEGLTQRTILYATDINQSALLRAKEGGYNMREYEKYKKNYHLSGGNGNFDDYFYEYKGKVWVREELKKSVVLSPHNLVTDRSFNEFQLIICRNVLIYFNQELQQRVINLFYESLCNFGFLALGNRETLLFSDKHDYFQIKDSAQKIFMKVL